MYAPKRADDYRKLYLTDRSLATALEFIEETYQSGRETPTSHIFTFLEGRSISPSSGLEEMAGMDDSQRALFGESYHFARKSILKHCETRNPYPLIEAAFEALAPVNNANAADFLEAFCRLMTEDGRSQPMVSTALGETLPELKSEYDTILQGIEPFKNDSHRYGKEKEAIDNYYAQLLNALVDYTEQSISSYSGSFREHRQRNGLLIIPANHRRAG